MARGIDDVDEDVLVVDGCVLGQNGDAALALEIGVVHRPFGHALVRAKRAALMQQRIHERGLAVIDVGDDGDIPAKWVGDLAAGRRWRAFNGRRHLLSIQNQVVRTFDARTIRGLAAT